jgi:hypothetical protein
MKTSQEQKSFTSLFHQESSIHFSNPPSAKTFHPKKANQEIIISPNVNVYLRVRPILKNEIKKKPEVAKYIKIQSNNIQIQHPYTTVRNWNFAEIFDENSKQKNVFEKTALPLLENLIKGFNVTMLVYGQTGTGS